MLSNYSELIHKCIVNNLAIRTLERDRNYTNGMKMQKAYELWFEAKILELHKELKNIKNQLSKSGVKIQSETQVDSLVTEYVILDQGTTYTLRYMNIALRNWVEEKVKKLLGLDN